MLGIISLVNNLFSIYSFVLVLYALLSWFPGAYDSALGRIVVRLSRPYLDFFDRYIPAIGGISFNVIIAILVLNLIQRGLNFLLIQLI